MLLHHKVIASTGEKIGDRDVDAVSFKLRRACTFDVTRLTVLNVLGLEASGLITEQTAAHLRDDDDLLQAIAFTMVSRYGADAYYRVPRRIYQGSSEITRPRELNGGIHTGSGAGLMPVSEWPRREQARGLFARLSWEFDTEVGLLPEPDCLRQLEYEKFWLPAFKVLVMVCDQQGYATVVVHGLNNDQWRQANTNDYKPGIPTRLVFCQPIEDWLEKLHKLMLRPPVKTDYQLGEGEWEGFLVDASQGEPRHVGYVQRIIERLSSILAEPISRKWFEGRTSGKTVIEFPPMLRAVSGEGRTYVYEEFLTDAQNYVSALGGLVTEGEFKGFRLASDPAHPGSAHRHWARRRTIQRKLADNLGYRLNEKNTTALCHRHSPRLWFNPDRERVVVLFPYEDVLESAYQWRKQTQNRTDTAGATAGFNLQADDDHIFLWGSKFQLAAAIFPEISRSTGRSRLKPVFEALAMIGESREDIINMSGRMIPKAFALRAVCDKAAELNIIAQTDIPPILERFGI